MFYLPDDDEPDTTYRSQGVHKNRDSTAKMQVDPMDREGVSDSERQQQQIEAAAAATAKSIENTPKRIGVDEKVAISRRQPDKASQVAANTARASAATVSDVEPGQILPPTPGSGSQASYGDGVPQGQGGGGGTNINLSMSYEGGEGGGGFSMGDMGGMMGGEGGGGGGGMGAAGGAMSSQIGQDIAAMDDTQDQATEALFQDDRTADAMEQMMDKMQGRS